jgi:NAD(P)-dependent dehydrogenase (short-subunit alcohol dehydrogenase family)
MGRPPVPGGAAGVSRCGGYIVDISIVGLPFSELYCASKFALEDMSRPPARG